MTNGRMVIGENCNLSRDVTIGASCVVTKDVPDYGVVAGIPGRVISFDGSDGYVNNTGYISFNEIS